MYSFVALILLVKSCQINPLLVPSYLHIAGNPPLPPPTTRFSALPSRSRESGVSAMYNMFVHTDVLATIQDVAGRLAASATSREVWASTELGHFVHFTDDRSQDRVRKFFSSYTDGSLQEKEVFMRVRRERTSFLATYMSKDNKNILSRAMGLASFRLGETMVANAKMRRQCTNQISCFTHYHTQYSGATILVKRGRAVVTSPIKYLDRLCYCIEHRRYDKCGYVHIGECGTWFPCSCSRIVR